MIMYKIYVDRKNVGRSNFGLIITYQMPYVIKNVNFRYR
jgi:hypothetical protein